jgi:transposase
MDTSRTLRRFREEEVCQMSRPKRSEGQELRRKFTVEFKREAVQLTRAGDRSVAEVARELGVRPEMLHTWIRQAAGLPGRLAAAARPSSQDEEVRQLRRELARVREERDILGKAMAFFARTPR